MGATLVAQVLTHWTDLSDPAFRVLVRMAVTALDAPNNGRPAAVYHGGRELLAMSLRSGTGTPRTRYRSVAKAVGELTEAGAIEHLATGWAGQNAVYRLSLGRARSVVPHDEMGGPTAHPEGGPTAHPMDVPSGTKRVVPQHTPRNQEEPIEERAEEERGSSRTASHPLRATSRTPKNCPDHLISLKPRTDGTQACPFCRRGVPPFEPTLATVTSIGSRRPA
jgi:hypothetical protein